MLGVSLPGALAVQLLDLSSESTCRRILEPYYEALLEIPREAFAKFLRMPDEYRVPLQLHKTVRANAVWSYMMQEADRLLSMMPGVYVIPRHGSKLFLVGSEVLLRFKKLDENGASRNYPTRRARHFNDPNQDSFDEIPAAAIRVDVGYQLDRLEQSISEVLVSHRNGKVVAWAYPVRIASQTVVIPFPTPAVAAEAAERRAKRRVFDRKEQGQDVKRESQGTDND
jgi:hypothetical protein